MPLTTVELIHREASPAPSLSLLVPLHSSFLQIKQLPGALYLGLCNGPLTTLDPQAHPLHLHRTAGYHSPGKSLVLLLLVCHSLPATASHQGKKYIS